MAETDLSYRSLEENLKTCRKNFEDFHRQLNDFPHSFQLENQDRLLVDQLNKVRRSLESALEVGYKTPVETARARNLLAFVLFRLGQPARALQETQEALNSEGEHQNLVSLANEAVILWHQGQRYKAQEIVQKLHNLKNEAPEFGYLAVKAKAELAFCYTRCDPSVYSLAQNIFIEVLRDAEEPDVWLWTFGLALTLRRQLRTTLNPTPSEIEEHLRVLRLYLGITKNCKSSNSLKAKAFAEIALVLYVRNAEQLESALQKEADMTVAQACEKALACDPDDNSALWKCGKLYRYLRQPDRSCELLKKATCLRPTTKGLHQLGLTYKALATQEKHKHSSSGQQSEDGNKSNETNTSGVDFQNFMRQLSRSASSENNSLAINNLHPAETQDQKSSETKISTTMATEATAQQSEETMKFTTSGTDTPTQEMFAMWKLVKSPTKGTTQFSREDPFIAEAIDSLLRAVEISEWENARAIYALAMLHKSLGEYELARECLEKSLWKEHCLGVFDKINFFEQVGLILNEMAEKQTDEPKKKQLVENSESMLLMALKIASEQFASRPEIKENIGNFWHSFDTLFQAVEDKDHSASQKLREKATLFMLIRKHKKSLALLQDIEAMDPQKGNDPEHMKLCIENYVELQQYEKALTFVDLLQCTAQSQKAKHLFDDARYVHKIGLLAAQQSLLRNSLNFKAHFRDVLKEYVAGQKLIATSSEDTDTEAESDLAKEDDSKKATDGTEKTTWDVLILHEDHEEDANLAGAVANILRDACGLKVTRNDDDVMPNKFAMEGVLSVMKKSSLVVVVTGQTKASRKLRQLLTYSARRETSVTLLFNEGHIPKMMKTHRFLYLPAELLQVTSAADCDNFAQDRVTAVCRLFGFLTDIDFGQISEP
ncbi:uncharacterized protein [Littorina saxatilis]|uniref:Uncharacterized protein n=1 Tax=Littorina saxatilis TaxID=31220 RepID=A0AAN9AK47_9CAEN